MFLLKLFKCYFCDFSTSARTKLDGQNAIGRVSPKKSRDSKPKKYGEPLTTSLSTNETKEPERGNVSQDRSLSVSAPRDEELSMTQTVVGKPNNSFFLCRHLIIIME